MPKTDDELILSEEDSRLLAAMVRPARRLLLAIAQTTNPKRRAKLEAEFRALHAKKGRRR